jgi:DNA (cytosine-5)-methyltransferase 1
MLTHGGRVRSVDDPLPTVTCAHRGEIGIVEPFMVPFYGERRGQDPRTHGIDDPVPTIPASGGGKFGVIEPLLLPPLGFYHLDGQNPARGIDRPVQTITSRGGGHIIQPFILHQMSWGRGRPVNEPVPTIVAKGTHHLIEPFIVQYNGTAGAQPTRIPLGTVTTRDRFGLVEGAELDITFRMLRPHELAAAQGFPRDYWFAGNQGEQVRQIGNAVPVNTARALALSALGAA